MSSRHLLIKNLRIWLPSVSLVLSHASAQEIVIESKVDTNGYLYKSEFNSEETGTNKVASIAPSVTAIYASKRLDMSVNAQHTKVEQIGNNNEADKSYTEFTFNSLATLIDNILTLSVTGQDNYRVINQDQNFISDKISATNDLAKVSNNAVDLTFTSANSNYLTVSAQAGFSETKTDQSTESLGLDGNNTSFSAYLGQGSDVERLRFNFSANYNDTTRKNFQDFTSTILNGEVTFLLNPYFNFIVQGNSSKYDVDTSGLATRTNLDTTSYGAGLEWQPIEDRSVSITYNQLDESDSTTKYVGLNLDWAFSSRTDLNFEYRKRFYGDAYSVDFNHRLKFFRSSLSYSEQVTSFSQLSDTNSDSNLFVCPIGSGDLSDCFQPDSLNYELQAGEQYIDSIDLNSNISEEIILRKSGSFNIGYDKRRLKSALTISYGETEYLESGEVQTVKSASLVISYQLSRKTDINSTTRVATSESQLFSYEDTTTTANLNLSHKLNQDLTVNTSLRLIDRDSDTISRELLDKRLTLGFSYSF